MNYEVEGGGLRARGPNGVYAQRAGRSYTTVLASSSCPIDIKKALVASTDIHMDWIVISVPESQGTYRVWQTSIPAY